MADTLDRFADSPSDRQPKSVHNGKADDLGKSNNISLEKQSFSSLVESLGLSPSERKSLPSLLKNVQHEVMGALEELKTITTHDDNLEKQYKETVEQNLKLAASLDSAKREIRKLKGKLSILEMTNAEIREERARKKHTEASLAHYNADLRRKEMKGRIHIMSRKERSFTVNSRGQYIRSLPAKPPLKRHQTYHVSSHVETLPPPVSGCKCSICQSVQSLGAMALTGGCLHAQGIAKSGQQILLHDKVVVKGQNTGTVKYIGRLENNSVLGTYIGVELDAPVGANDGTHKKQRYFECRDHHGVFVRPSDILCVTQRKPMMTASFGRRKKIPPPVRTKPIASKETPQHVFLYKQIETLGPIDSRNEVERELLKIAQGEDLSQYQGSVASMSRRLKVLKGKHMQKDLSVVSPPPAPGVDPQHAELQAEIPEQQPSTTGRGSPSIDKQETKPGVDPEQELVPEPKQEPEPKQDENGPIKESLPDQKISLEDQMSDLLEKELQEKDLGSTGFVTGGEIFSVLTSHPLNDFVKLADSELVALLENLGIEKDDNAGVAIPYRELIPQLVSMLSGDIGDN